jgi:hypothetical protein
MSIALESPSQPRIAGTVEATPQKVTLLLFHSPDARVRLYAYDDDWHMYRYPEPEGTEVARSLAKTLNEAPFTEFPEQRTKRTQYICERLRGMNLERDRESEQRYDRLNRTLRLSGVHHTYVLFNPIAVHHLGLSYIPLDQGFRAYPVGELHPPEEDVHA